MIGPHGAGLSNIVGCEPGTHLYELVPSHYPNFCFNRLAQGCLLHYWGDVFPRPRRGTAVRTNEPGASTSTPWRRGWSKSAHGLRLGCGGGGMSDDKRPAEPAGRFFRSSQKAGFASRMLQYMVAVKFQSLVPGCRIANVMLPEWGIEHPPVESPGPVIAADQYHSIDLDELTERARAGEGCRVVYSGFGRRMENFLDVEACRGVFRSPAVAPLAFDERHLVCPIVAEDTPDDRGPFHPLTPVEFYADIVAETGLTPVFVGQGAPGRYTERLRAQFPRRNSLPPATPWASSRRSARRRTSSSGSALWPGWPRGCHMPSA